MADKITLTPLFDVGETQQDVASTPERITLKPLDDSLPEYIQNREGDEEGTITEIGEGIVSGLIGIGQGIGELGASAIDLIADTDYASDVTESADALRDALGVDPEGLAGSIAEIGTQFVLPGLGAASAVSKLSKLGRLSKAARAKPNLASMSRAQKLALGAQQAAAAGVADAMVATDNIRTIGDFFDGGPTMTDQEIGLSGQEEAARRILNKLKIGAEGAGLAATIPVALAKALSATGAGLGAAAKGIAAVPGTQAVGETVSGAARKAGQGVSDLRTRSVEGDESLNLFQKIVADVAGSLQYRGALPQEVANLRARIAGATEGQVQKVNTNFAKFEKQIDKYEKSLPKDQMTSFQRQEMFDTLFTYLTAGKAAGPEVLARLPKTAQRHAKEMRKQVNELSSSIKDSAILKKMDDIEPAPGSKEVTSDMIRQTIDNNMDAYIRRRYRMYTDSTYSVKPGSATWNQGRDSFLKDRKSLYRELKFIAEDATNPNQLKAQGYLDTFNDTLPKQAGDLAVGSFLKRHKPKAKSSAGAEPKSVAKERLNISLFKDRKELKEFERRLLGEVTDAKEALIGTVSDLAHFKAIDDFQGGVKELAKRNSGIGRYFLDNPEQIPDGYVKLTGKEFGVLENYAVPARIQKDLARTVGDDTNSMMAGLRATYSGFLKLKGVSQFSKTVLSPITQIRNVTTASFFALAQGNVGRGANLGESIGMVLKDIGKKGDEALTKELLELQELGVIGTQAQLKELQELIKRGASTEDVQVINGIEVGADFGSVFKQGRLGDFLGSVGKKARPITDKATDFYQGGDNVWKIYNYKFEQSKIKNALRGLSLNDQATQLKTLGFPLKEVTEEAVERSIREYSADIVRNTVPNYNLAPEFIRGLRRLPVGNFIAFPYEIYRTGFNTIGIGLKELSSESAAIREIGLRRLTGAATTFAVIPASLSAFAYNTSGVSEEEMDAYKRSFAPPWERNSRLIPTGRNEAGNITYINFSYSNPYDLLERGLNAAINEVETAKELGRDPSEAVFRAGFGAMTESFSSFISPSIMTNKISDVAPVTALGRGGRTETGSRVYNPEDSVGDKMAKSFAHVMDGIMPSGLPVQVRGGKFEASRFARGVLGDTQLGDALGIAPEDRRDRDYELAQELIRGFTGITELEANTEQALGYKGFEFSRARTNASNIFNREANSANATRQSMLDAYTDADDARYRVYNEFYQAVEDLRTIGVSDQEIRRTLKKNKVGDVNSIMRNRYNPLKISSQTIKNMREVGSFSEYPRQEIREIQRERRNMEFAVPEEVFEDDTPLLQPTENIEEKRPLSSPVEPQVVPQPTATAPQASFYTAPGVTSGVLSRISMGSIQDSAKARGVTPEQLIQTAGLQPVQPDASLLGDDPVTIARNMQIAQRTRRG